MEGTYPLMIDGKLMGKLTVTPKGAGTEFSVSCRMLPGIVRISVYGGGREGYLGVLAPEAGELRLRRCLSRSALREFPTELSHAGRAGETVCDAAPDEAAAEPEAQPRPESESEPELHWYASPDGALVCFDGVQNLLALPVGDERIPGSGGVRRTVEGRDYMVFRTRNGRLVTD